MFMITEVFEWSLMNSLVFIKLSYTLLMLKANYPSDKNCFQTKKLNKNLKIFMKN